MAELKNQENLLIESIKTLTFLIKHGYQSNDVYLNELYHNIKNYIYKFDEFVSLMIIKIKTS